MDYKDEYMRVSGLMIDQDNQKIKDWLFAKDSRIKEARLIFARPTNVHERQLGFLHMEPYVGVMLDGWTRHGALQGGLGEYIPIRLGERIEVEFLPPTFNGMIEVRALMRSVSAKFRIRHRDLKSQSLRSIKVKPKVPFRITAKVIELKGSTVMLKEM